MLFEITVQNYHILYSLLLIGLISRYEWHCTSPLPPSQSITNIRVHSDIRIFLNKYIHILKYSGYNEMTNIFGYSFTALKITSNIIWVTGECIFCPSAEILKYIHLFIEYIWITLNIFKKYCLCPSWLEHIHTFFICIKKYPKSQQPNIFVKIFNIYLLFPIVFLFRCETV